MDAPHLLSLETAADRLAVSTRTLRRLLAAGDLPSVRIRAARRILASDLSAYIASRSTGSDNSPGVAVNGETTCHENKYATKTGSTNGRTRPIGGAACRVQSAGAFAAVLGFPSPRTPRA
ncbi:MAG: helix-turn-helix domain-containing protein [Chromatiaceae bacterium]